jgi:pimeloyl-ACP methyl ester carboxylesterase
MEHARAMLARAQRGSLVLAERGVEIACLDWGGDGPLALLHHATGFCKGVWAPVAEALRERFRVIAIDARGHGDSSLPEGEAAYDWREFWLDLVAVAERLTARHGRVALGMGHSFGGTAFLAASRARPDLFARNVLVDPVVPIWPTTPEERAVPRENPLAEGARRRRTEWASRAEAIEKWQRRTFFAAWRPEALALYALDGLRERADGSVTLKCPSGVEASIFEQARGIDADAAAAGNETPTLWLHAQRGDFPIARYEALARTMRAARVEALDAGHLVVMEQPELVVDAALRFCAA